MRFRNLAKTARESAKSPDHPGQRERQAHREPLLTRNATSEASSRLDRRSGICEGAACYFDGRSSSCPLRVKLRDSPRIRRFLRRVEAR